MGADILDEQGQPIPKHDSVVIRGLRWLQANWRVWIPIALSSIALLISGGSLFLSVRNNEMNRRLAKLDLRPTLRLESYFFSVGGGPPLWSLANAGPVDAIQIKVELIAHRYDPEWSDLLASMKGTSQTTIIPRLEPHERKAYAFPKNWLDYNAKQGQPPQNNIMEIMVTYRRPQDLRKYSASAYYFVDPNERWVSERTNTLQGEPYESMKTAIRKLHRGPLAVFYGERGAWSGDLLHPNE